LNSQNVTNGNATIGAIYSNPCDDRFLSVHHLRGLTPGMDILGILLAFWEGLPPFFIKHLLCQANISKRTSSVKSASARSLSRIDIFRSS
jgi:hypothetical protein